jgi:hypothetical protein
VAGFGKPLHIRLFLEGVEVPVVAAQVSTHLNGPAAASIQVVPLDEVMKLKPRTMVHLFFLEKPAKVDAQTGNLEEYRLLFTGEIVGFAWIQRSNARSVVLQCIDFSSYWDAATATSIDYGPNGDAFTQQSAFYGSNASVFDNVMNFEPNQLVEWIKQAPQTLGLQSVSGIAGGVIRILEAISGIQGSHRGVNDFFTVAELRCRILSQICAEENDNTSLNLLKEKVFDEWVRQGLQSLGGQVTFRQMMEMLFRYIYYDFVPNPTAKYDPFHSGKKHTSEKTRNIRQIGSVTSNSTKLKAIQADLESRLRSADAAKGVASSSLTQIRTIIADLKRSLPNSPTVLKACRKLESASALLGDIAKSGSAENLFQMKDIGEAAAILTDESNTEQATVTHTTTDATSSRLRSHILRPDCWFAAPPRCNVIFPEHYTDLSYDRTFITEATRMLLMFYNTLVGQNLLFANKIIAPSIGTHSKLLTGQQAQDGYRNLMKHELHTGVIARAEWIPNTAAPQDPASAVAQAKNFKDPKLKWGSKISLFNFFRERFASRQASISGRFNPYVVCGFPAVVIKRPYIVSHSSSDRRGNQDILNTIQDPTFARANNAPSQLLGMVHSVTHAISQEGGVTSMSMNYVREHLGVDDEFIDVFTKTKDKVKSRIRVVLNAADLIASGNEKLSFLVKVTPQTPPAVGSATKRGAQKTSVTQSTTKFNPVTKQMETSQSSVDITRTTESQVKSPSSLVVLGKIDGMERDAFVPVGGNLHPQSKGMYGVVAGVEVLDPNVSEVGKGPYAGKQVFESVAVYEDVTLTGTKNVAVEELMRPSWFSKNYKNENIGPVIYSQFFGTGSIIDEVHISGLAQRVVDTQGQEGVDTSPDTESDILLAKLQALSGDKIDSSIEKSVNLLGYFYGIAKVKGLDIDDFITQYTYRPIAGLTDILGDNVSISVNGQVATPQAAIRGRPFKVGFHTMSVHPDTASRGQLLGLLDDPNSPIPRINKEGRAEAIPPSYDVRNEKWEKVMEYSAALEKGPGFRG